MFTGIIKGQGNIARSVRTATQQRLTIHTPLAHRWHSQIGDSLAINGVCLTIIAMTDQDFTVDVMPETYHRTTLGDQAIGDAVNLEPALRVGDRLGGHLVLGHVDTVAQLVDRTPDTNAEILTFEYPTAYYAELAEKGSVTLDGVSLTLVTVSPTQFSVSLIPQTLHETSLGRRQPGDNVNLETDVLAKYLLHQREVKS